METRGDRLSPSRDRNAADLSFAPAGRDVYSLNAFLNPLRSDRSETGRTFRSAGAKNISVDFGSINISLRWSEGHNSRFAAFRVEHLWLSTTGISVSRLRLRFDET
jgi:hypothetical protein